jgi:hypothetical protein
LFYSFVLAADVAAVTGLRAARCFNPRRGVKSYVIDRKPILLTIERWESFPWPLYFIAVFRKLLLLVNEGIVELPSFSVGALGSGGHGLTVLRDDHMVARFLDYMINGIITWPRLMPSEVVQEYRNGTITDARWQQHRRAK